MRWLFEQRLLLFIYAVGIALAISELQLPEQSTGLLDKPEAYFDTQTPPEDRQQIMSFYKACVQRHLYVHGTSRRFLSKNPAFSPKLDALNEFFPDSKAVCNVRNPYQAIPSLLSFLSFSWDRFGNDPKGNTFRDMILDMAGS